MSLSDFLNRRRKMSPLRVLDDYIARPGIKQATRQNDMWRLTGFCDRHRAKGIAGIRAKDVDDWIEELGRRYDSQASVETCKQSISSFFNWCVKNQYINAAQNPAAHVRYRRKTSARDKAAPAGNVQKVIAYMMKKMDCEWPKPLDIRDLLAICLAADSGKRRAELANLSTKQMNRALANPALVNGVVVYGAKTKGKTGEAKLRFTEQTAAIYRLWQLRRPNLSPERVFVALGGKDSGRPMTLDGFTSIFVRRCKEVGVPVFRTHAIRHKKGTEVSDKHSPAAAAALLNITVETAMLHYYDAAEKVALEAIAESARER